jgi:uncharacterized protein (TIRG00374 family)
VVDPGRASLAVLILSLQYPLSAWKWRMALQAHGLNFAFGYLLRAICIGSFFNNFLPTSVGGDAWRAYRTIQPGGPRMRSISAIVLERLLGIAALLIIGSLCAAALLARHALLHTALVGLLLAAGAGACIVFLAAWYAGPVRRRLARLTHSPKLEPLSQNLRNLAVHPRQLTATVALSFLFQILAVVVITVLFSAVGVDASFLQAGFIAVASGVAGVLPISINGIGVIEGSFAAAALETRLPFHEAVFVALFLRFYMLVASMLCGVLYALEPLPSRCATSKRI